jgi:hypothetical protein
MPNLFKPDVVRKLPPDAEIVQRDGVPHVRLSDKGRPAFYRLTANGQGYLKPSAKWCSNVIDSKGRRKRIFFSTRQDVSQKMLTDLLTRVEREKAGIIDRFADHRQSSLVKHLSDWKANLLASGGSAEYASLKEGRARRVLEA